MIKDPGLLTVVKITVAKIVRRNGTSGEAWNGIIWCLRQG